MTALPATTAPVDAPPAAPARRPAEAARVVLLAAATAGTVALVGAVGAPLPRAVVVVAAVAAVLLRQRRLVRENRRLASTLRRAVHETAAELHAREAELSYQNLHDTLTGLPNRSLFVDRLDTALAVARRQGTGLGVLFVDLDDFKTVNEGLGHRAGDAVLREVGDRITGALRPLDTVARLGGDEFAVLLQPLAGHDHASKVTERILDAVQAPVVVDGRELHVAASIGIALATGDTDVERLMSQADVAMYRAKESGKAGFAVFEAEMQQQVLERLTLRAEVQRAIEQGEIEPFYQPIVDLATGRIVSVEALARWRHPERGLLSPFHFVPLAEETGQIVAIGRQMLARACAQLQDWRSTVPALDTLSVSVNLSARQLQDPLLVDHVAADLAAAGLPPTCLILEVTETMLMADIDAAVARLQRIKSFGVRIALDDFGTGFSSLSYLQKLPIDQLKIDKSFIDLLQLSAPRDAQWAEAVVTIGRILDLTVIAEGIESDHQLQALRTLRCARGQGYLFARPLAADELLALLVEQSQAHGHRSTPSVPAPGA